MARRAFRPVVELAYIDDDLPFGIELDLGAIHWARRGAFKVDALAVVTAAVARTLEFILARLPIGRAAEVRAARVDDEKPLGVLYDPDAILLLPLGINAERVVAGKADSKVLDGSKIARGRKKRKNIRKLVVKNPATMAQIMRRRVLLTGGSGALSTIAPDVFGGAGDLITGAALDGAGAETVLSGVPASPDGLSTYEHSFVNLMYLLSSLSLNLERVHCYIKTERKPHNYYIRGFSLAKRTEL